jgi:hypothetical protein
MRDVAKRGKTCLKIVVLTPGPVEASKGAEIKRLRLTRAGGKEFL